MNYAKNRSKPYKLVLLHVAEASADTSKRKNPSQNKSSLAKRSFNLKEGGKMRIIQKKSSQEVLF